MLYKAYSNKEIRQIADSTREKYLKYPKQIPIDVELIIDVRLGIEIRAINFLKNDSDFLGMLSHDLKTIVVDSSIYTNPAQENRYRFTLAHELGHFVLHGSYLSASKFKSIDEWIDFLQSMDQSELNIYERNCNEFAGRLLVPPDNLVAEVDKLRPEMEKLKEQAQKGGLEDYMINDRLSDWVATKIHPKFMVAPKTLSIRMQKEGIVL